MASTLLLVGTRKGCFVLQSDGDRRDWSIRGPFCEGWPIYHAVHDADSGAIYAAAASEWHGAGVWRSRDLGESWELSSEGLSYSDDGLKLSKVSGLTAAHGRLLAGAEAAGIFESRDGGVTWSLLSTLDGEPGRDSWNDPSKQPPGHLGLSAIPPHPDDASRYRTPDGWAPFETVADVIRVKGGADVAVTLRRTRHGPVISDAGFAFDVLGPKVWREGAFAQQYLRSFAATIPGGTSEIQRNIIAERILGLPR